MLGFQIGALIVFGVWSGIGAYLDRGQRRMLLELERQEFLKLGDVASINPNARVEDEEWKQKTKKTNPGNRTAKVAPLNGSKPKKPKIKKKDGWTADIVPNIVPLYGYLQPTPKKPEKKKKECCPPCCPAWWPRPSCDSLLTLLRQEHAIGVLFCPVVGERIFFGYMQRVICYYCELQMAFCLAAFFHGHTTANFSQTLFVSAYSAVLMFPISVIIPMLFMKARTFESTTLLVEKERAAEYARRVLVHKATSQASPNTPHIRRSNSHRGPNSRHIRRSNSHRGPNSRHILRSNSHVSPLRVMGTTTQVSARRVKGPTAQVNARRVKGRTAQVNTRRIKGPTAYFARIKRRRRYGRNSHFARKYARDKRRSSATGQTSHVARNTRRSSVTEPTSHFDRGTEVDFSGVVNKMKTPQNDFKTMHPEPRTGVRKKRKRTGKKSKSRKSKSATAANAAAYSKHVALCKAECRQPEPWYLYNMIIKVQARFCGVMARRKASGVTETAIIALDDDMKIATESSPNQSVGVHEVVLREGLIHWGQDILDHHFFVMNCLNVVEFVVHACFWFHCVFLQYQCLNSQIKCTFKKKCKVRCSRTRTAPCRWPGGRPWP